MGRALAAGEASAVDAANAVLARLDGVGAALNVAIRVTPERALRDAEASDLRRRHGESQGALDGVPLGVKDIYDVVGIPTTAGSAFLGRQPAVEDAAVVARLRRAGMVCVAKLHTHEWALGVTSVNPHFGPARNPFDPTCIPGGSSGGSAAALAARVLPAALGSDTGGSIRIPAALCGVTGLKPTRGTWSVRGVIPLSWTMDHTGPMARSVSDLVAILEAGAGYDPLDPASRRPRSARPPTTRGTSAAIARRRGGGTAPLDTPQSDLVGVVARAAQDPRTALTGLRIGVVTEFVDLADAEIAALVIAAAGVLAANGAIVAPEVMLTWHAARRAARTILLSDAAAYHAQRLAASPELFGADVRGRLEAGRDFSGAEVAEAHRDRTAWRRQLGDIFATFDVLLAPATPRTGLAIDAVEGISAALNMTQFTAVFNLAGCPSLVVPCGFTAAGHPVGLQMIAADWNEETLLVIGAAYQAMTAWHEMAPEMAQ